MSQKSGSAIRIRNCVEFDWGGTSASTPPGRESAAFLRVALSTDAHTLYPLTDRGEEGWEFEVGLDEGPRVRVVVRRMRRWLVILRPLPYGIVRKSWESPIRIATGLLTAGQAVHAFLANDNACRDVRWYTAEEYAGRREGEGPAGSSVPSRA